MLPPLGQKNVQVILSKKGVNLFCKRNGKSEICSVWCMELKKCNN